MTRLTQVVSRALARLRRWAAPPAFEDPIKTRTMALINVLMLAAAGLWPVFVALLAVLRVGHRVNLLIALAASTLLLGVRELMRRGHRSLAVTFGVGAALAVVSSFLYNLGTVHSVHLAGYLLVIFMAAWLGGARAAVATGLLSVASVFVLARAETAGLLPPPAAMPSLNLVLNMTAYLAASALLMLLARTHFVQSLLLAKDEIARRQEVEKALRELNATLEERVEERTEALRASEQRYRMLLMLSPDGISVADQAGRISACNEQFAHMHGFDYASEMIGRNAQELARPEAFAELGREVAAALERGEGVARDIEVEVLRRDGSLFPAEYSVAQVPWPDAPSGVAYLANSRDITKRKKLAAELEQHQAHLEELVAKRTRDLQAEIAERTAAQAALLRSEHDLAEAGRIALVGSWEADLATDVMRFSGDMPRVFGFITEERPFTRVDLLKAIHPDDRDAVQAAMQRATEPGQDYSVQYRVVLPGGDTRVVYVKGEVLRDATGRPTHIRGMVQDITERERVRAALDRHVQELSSLQELGRLVSLELPLEEAVHIYLQRIVAIAGLDMAQVFLLREGRLHLEGFSTAPAALAAGGPALVVGECLSELAVHDRQLVYTGDIENDPRLSQAHRRDPGLHSLAALPLRSGDTIIGALAVCAAPRDAFADRLGFLETISDLIALHLHNALLHQEIRARAAGLEQTVAERTLELQAERDRTQAILDTVGESVIVTDLDGHVLFVNPATEILTGYSRSETLGQPIWHHWPADVLKEIWPQAQQALRSGQMWRGEVTGSRRDATVYDVALTGTPLRDESAAPSVVTGGVWVQRDITAAKEAERLKDQFIANVSHELRTPLASIKAYTELLLADVEVEDRALRQRFLSVIDAEADQLAQFINNLLDLSRLQSGPIAGQHELISLGALISEITRLLDIQAHRAGVSIRLDLPDGLPMISANKELMQSMVRNLIGNAIKYSPTGGEVRVGAHAAGEAIVLEVSDSGIGIPPDDLPRIFTRFYRSWSARQYGIGGTGLGLVVAREAVERHGGTIAVESQMGVGTRFSVTLPVATDRASTEPPSDPGCPAPEMERS